MSDSVNNPDRWHTSMESFGFHYSPDYVHHLTDEGVRSEANVTRILPGGKTENTTSRLTPLDIKRYGNLKPSSTPSGLNPIQFERHIPLEKLAYSHQSHVDLEHARKLSTSLDPKTQDTIAVQAQPDGRHVIIDGHHRAAAAALRGDKKIRADVYGGWEPRA